MNRVSWLWCGALLLCTAMTGGVAAKGASPGDAEIKQAIIAESVAAYPGVCACPWNRARNGSACGGRSAWSRAGGYSPICYEKEVTPQMIARWRAARR